MHEAQWLHSEEESELYEVKTEGVAVQALLRHDPTLPPVSGSSQ